MLSYSHADLSPVDGWLALKAYLSGEGYAKAVSHKGRDRIITLVIALEGYTPHNC